MEARTCALDRPEALHVAKTHHSSRLQHPLTDVPRTTVPAGQRAPFERIGIDPSTTTLETSQTIGILMIADLICNIRRSMLCERNDARYLLQPDNHEHPLDLQRPRTGGLTGVECVGMSSG